MARHLLALKSIKNYLRTQLHPNAVYTLRLNNKSVPASDANSVIAYIYAYLVVFVVGSLLLTLIGADLFTATSGVATAMGGIGPGFGTIGPVSNFAHLPDISKLILSLMMLLGRLELYTIIILLSASFWRK